MVIDEKDLVCGMYYPLNEEWALAVASFGEIIGLRHFSGIDLFSIRKNRKYMTILELVKAANHASGVSSNERYCAACKQEIPKTLYFYAKLIGL